MKAHNVVNIIEYQNDIQRTPLEAIDYLREEIKNGQCAQMLVIYTNESTFSYLPASDGRNFKKSEILWLIEQWKAHYLLDPEK